MKQRIEAALANHPDAKILTQEEFEKEAAGFIDQLLTFVTVMLLLAVFIALLGIVNTLALSVYERTRELGLLRAVGMTKSQVRQMVRWESVVISLIGAAAGAVLGTGLGLVLAQALKDEGIKSVSVPWQSISLYVVAAALFAVAMVSLLCLELLQVRIQALVARVPEAAIAFGPLRDPLERRRLEPAGTPLRVAAATDEARALQHPEVLRDRGLAHREWLAQLLYGGRA